MKGMHTTKSTFQKLSNTIVQIINNITYFVLLTYNQVLFYTLRPYKEKRIEIIHTFQVGLQPNRS